MRRLVAICFVVAWSGCLDDPLPARGDGTPVIVVDRGFRVLGADGRPISSSPPSPCLDTIAMSKTSQKIYVDPAAANPELAHDAEAIVAFHVGDPEQPPAVHAVEFVATANWSRTLTLGNVRTLNATLRIDGEDVSLNGAGVPPAHVHTLRFDYEWRRDDGVVLNVTESIAVDYAGVWRDPVEFRPQPAC